MRFLIAGPRAVGAEGSRVYRSAVLTADQVGDPFDAVALTALALRVHNQRLAA